LSKQLPALLILKVYRYRCTKRRLRGVPCL